MSDERKKGEGDSRDIERILGVSRRDFLLYCGGLAGALALGCGSDSPEGRAEKKIAAKSDAGAERVAKALAEAVAKPPVIWLAGQECTGCSINFLNLETPDIATVLLDKISLRYHEAVMAAAGHVSESALRDTIAAGGYVLVVEGSIPSADDRFCEIGGRSFKSIVEECCAKAAVVIAAGSCACYGGIPGAGPTVGKGVSAIVEGRPVINLPHCPVHHEHLFETIVYWLEKKAPPELDDKGRPKLFFSKLVHDQCPRKKHYDEGNYLNDWNDPAQRDWCLAEKGCKGPEAHSDCVTRKYNGGVNHCLSCGSPCQGCSEPGFYGAHSPLYAFDMARHDARKERMA